MAEGAPLLRAYRLIPIEGSNPSLSAIQNIPTRVRAANCGNVSTGKHGEGCEPGQRVRPIASQSETSAPARSPQGQNSPKLFCLIPLVVQIKLSPPWQVAKVSVEVKSAKTELNQAEVDQGKGKMSRS